MSIKDLKIECKDIANRIRKTRAEDKDYQRGVREEYPEESLFTLRFQFRHKHIAYCQLRGRDYSVIETNPSTEPSWSFIDELKELHKEVVDAEAAETVRACA